ncbi:unnamed protein product [Symbiodinium microadriaticum]|nr:unnamed protein product [Symbiodinium microadriaticum]
MPQMVAEPSQPIIEDRVIERTVASEISRSALPSPAFPWERGVFRAIFGSEDSSNPFDNLIISVPGPLLPAHNPAAAVNEPRPPIPTLDIASRAFGVFQDVHPSQERDQLMDKAVCKLQLIVSRFNKSRLSSELRNALDAASPQAQLQETIAACVGLRSPHTVLKRANAILAFLRWADKEDTLEPLSEGTVWDFFSWLKREGAPPSRAASLMSAFRFINFVLGVSLQDLLYSRRLCGLSIQLGVQKTSASRARPLTVNEIKYLHKVLEDTKETNWDRAIAGYLLLALYARARHSDFLQVEEVIPDFDTEGGGYLEVRLRVHKTAQTLAKRNDLLPVIVAARSIKEGDWLGSHSLKRTILDWGSKFCIDDAILALLGRHSKCVKGSVPVYAREESLRAVKAIEPMLRAIADGSFKPDASRANYFPKNALPLAGESATSNTATPATKVEVIEDSDEEPCEEAPEVEGSGSSSTSSGANSESSESEEPAWDQESCLANAKTHALHLLKHVSGYWPRRAAAILAKGEVPLSDGLTERMYKSDERVRGPLLMFERRQMFGRRASEVGLSSTGWATLETLGLTSIGKAAYTITSPGEAVTEPVFKDWIAENAANLALGDQACLKRLIFEAQTLVVADLRDQVSGSSGATPRKVPEAERDRRLNDLRMALPGITLDGVNLPSNSLLDACCQQALQVEASKIILKHDGEEIEYQPVNALQTMEAFRRRGLAMVFAQMVSYSSYDRYINRLFNHLSRDPPPGLNRIGVAQLVNADKHVFSLLVEWGVKPRRDPTGTYPLDAGLQRALESYEVSVLLMHQAPGKGNPKGGPRKRPYKGTGQEAPTKTHKGKDGKGNGKGRKGTPPLPKELIDLKGELPEKLQSTQTTELQAQRLLSLDRATIEDVFSLLQFLPSEHQRFSGDFSWASGCAQSHLPWGRDPATGDFTTAQETAYPHALADAIAKCFTTAVQRVGDNQLELAWGVSWSPEEFMQEAVEAGHPRTFDTVLPSALEHSIAFNAESNPAEVAGLRAAWFSKWTNKATELSAEDDKLKSSLPDYARDILLPKRIALWREILRDLEYPDLGVVDEMLGGVVLTGQTPCTNIFPAAFKPAKHTDRDLEANAESEQKMILGAIKSQGHLDILLEEKVDEEVELGWLSEPVDLKDVPSTASISRRFAIEQGDKIRLIDDLSDSGVNGAVQTTESPKPQSLDVVAAMVLECLKFKET